MTEVYLTGSILHLIEVLGAANPNFNISAYLEAFGNLTTNLERVNYVYEDLQNYNFIHDERRETKDDFKSQIFREEGNRLFREGAYKQALLYYSFSLTIAESPESLAFSYSNRSAALYKLEKYQECLEDIERAFDNGYPDDLKARLISRGINAERMLQSLPPEQPYYQNVPEFAEAEKHPAIPSAKNCLQIEANQEFGRHIVATRDIEIGEIICIEKPYVSSVIIEQLVHCHNCLELCYNPIPCDKCVFPVFCSDYCKDQACATFHKYECSAMGILLGCQMTATNLLPIRVALLAKQDTSSEVDEEETYRSDRYKEISNLTTAIEKYPVDTLLEYAVTAAAIFHIFLTYTSIFNCPDNDIVKDQFKENLLLQSLICYVNRLVVAETTVNATRWESRAFAYSLYSFASLFNHSCCPNVESIQYGRTTVLRTVNSIKMGQQCFTAYGSLYWAANKVDRARFLENQYFFECKCVACANNWNSWERMLVLDMCDVMALLSDIEFYNGYDLVANNYLPHYIEQLKMYEQYEPSDNIITIKQIISALYKIFGNKRGM